MSQELPKEAISFSAQFGGEDVQEALKPHFFALKREWIGGIGIGDTISSA